MILPMSTPSASAAICARTVSLPCPISVAPVITLNEPSSLSLMDAPPNSKLATPLPCIAVAMPRPRRKGFPSPRSKGWSQPNAVEPRSRHCGRPHERNWRFDRHTPFSSTISMGSQSPFCTWFLRRNSSGSILSLCAISSMCDSRAKNP